MSSFSGMPWESIAVWGRLLECPRNMDLALHSGHKMLLKIHIISISSLLLQSFLSIMSCRKNCAERAGRCRCLRCPARACRGAARRRSPFWPRSMPWPSTVSPMATDCGSATMQTGSNLLTLCTLRSSLTSKVVSGQQLARLHQISSLLVVLCGGTALNACFITSSTRYF